MADMSAISPALALSDWLSRDLLEPDFLLGELLSTTSRLLIVGPTGLGKTMFGLAVAFALAGNKGFLHWEARRSGRVLYVDGEMSARLMKRRLTEAVGRAGMEPEGLCILSREDFPEMPPLNSKEGQRWLDHKIAGIGPFDLVIFDNIQALLVGDMKEEEQWAKILDWVRDLTRRSIGQLWFHHTGHDETRSYGSKAREWQFDTVALMERVDTKEDLAFTLRFTKARGRTSENSRGLSIRHHPT
jgi:RecA-family ATPase